MKKSWSESSKRKTKRNCILLLFMLLLLCMLLYNSYRKKEGLRFVQKMGNGINLGNTLDATNLRDYKPEADDLDYETFWGNPKITREQLLTIREAGFRTVRIPVTFEDHLDKDFNISKRWMNRVTEVIDMALAEGLYVIIDLHGDEYMDLQVSNKETIKANFEKVWTQIAMQFRDYDNHLLFEGMNEPRLRESEYEWTEGTPELRAFVNELNQNFVDTVRNIGGNNQERYLLICPYCNGPWEKALEDLAVPRGNIIVAVHMYRPYNFCQNETGTVEWDRNVHEDTFESEEAFRLMGEKFIQNDIPVIFTEFGCVDKNNAEERKEWASFYMELSKKYQIPCIWWDNGSTYQLLDREKNEWIYPDIVSVIANTED